MRRASAKRLEGNTSRRRGDTPKRSEDEDIRSMHGYDRRRTFIAYLLGACVCRLMTKRSCEIVDLALLNSSTTFVGSSGLPKGLLLV